MQFLLMSLAVIALSVCGFAASAATYDARSDEISRILIKMEFPAENMLDQLAIRNLGKLRPLYKEMAADMDLLNHQNTRTGATAAQSRNIALLNSWFKLVSTEMKKMHDIRGLAYDINQFSGQIINSIQFHNDYEKEVDWMDYLGRDIALLNQPSDSAPDARVVGVRKQELQVTWNRLKPLLANSPKGPALVRQVDPIIRELMHEQRPDRLVVLARQEQEMVDKIEVFFHINGD